MSYIECDERSKSRERSLTASKMEFHFCITSNRLFLMQKFSSDVQNNPEEQRQKVRRLQAPAFLNASHFICLYKTASQIITGTFSLIRNARLSFPSRLPFRRFLFLFRNPMKSITALWQLQMPGFLRTQRGLSAGLLLIYAPAVIL